MVAALVLHATYVLGVALSWVPLLPRVSRMWLESLLPILSWPQQVSLVSLSYGCHGVPGVPHFMAAPGVFVATGGPGVSIVTGAALAITCNAGALLVSNDGGGGCPYVQAGVCRKSQGSKR